MPGPPLSGSREEACRRCRSNSPPALSGWGRFRVVRVCAHLCVVLLFAVVGRRRWLKAISRRRLGFAADCLVPWPGGSSTPLLVSYPFLVFVIMCASRQRYRLEGSVLGREIRVHRRSRRRGQSGHRRSVCGKKMMDSRPSDPIWTTGIRVGRLLNRDRPL
jgi:hypothetical protein